MVDPNDNLISKAVLGDRDALVALLKQHGLSVRRSLSGKISQRWQSVLSEDDVMQQTYADAASNIAQFKSKDERQFVKWLQSIAMRNLQDAIKMLMAEKRGGRDRKQVNTIITEDSCIALIDLLSGSGSTPSNYAAKTEAKTVLEKAIEQLPEDYARVVITYDLEGRSVKEVAEVMNRSEGAIFMLRARAHQRLHEIMGSTSKFFSSS